MPVESEDPQNTSPPKPPKRPWVPPVLTCETLPTTDETGKPNLAVEYTDGAEGPPS
jgi:hypothetical protein